MMKIKPEYMRELRNAIKLGKRDAQLTCHATAGYLGVIAAGIYHTGLNDTQVTGIGYAYVQAFTKTHQRHFQAA